MPVNLTITDGTDSVDLGTTLDQSVLAEYVMNTPSLEENYVDNPLLQGKTLSSSFYNNVQESGTSLLLGGYVIIRNKLNILNRLFEKARYLAVSGVKAPPVYIKYRSNDNEPYYRSKLLSGQVSLGSEALSERFGVTGTDSPNYLSDTYGKLEIKFSITREYFWEAESEVEVVANNPSGQGSWINHYNANSSGKYNYLKINSGIIQGDLPAPVNIEIVNVYGGSLRLGKVWVGQNILSTHDQYFFEAENAENKYSGSTVASSAASNGSYLNYNIPAGQTYSLISKTLSSSFLNKTKGAPFKILANVLNSPGDEVYFSANLSYFNLTKLSETNYIQRGASDSLVNLGTLRFPPNYQLGDSPFDIELQLNCKNLSSISKNIQLDFLTILPAEGFRLLQPKGYYTPNGYVLSDNSYNGVTGVRASGVILYNYVGYGLPIYLWPNISQTLSFLIAQSTGSLAFDKLARIRLLYRPRRLVL